MSSFLLLPFSFLSMLLSLLICGSAQFAVAVIHNCNPVDGTLTLPNPSFNGGSNDLGDVELGQISNCTVRIGGPGVSVNKIVTTAPGWNSSLIIDGVTMNEDSPELNCVVIGHSLRNMKLVSVKNVVVRRNLQIVPPASAAVRTNVALLTDDGPLFSGTGEADSLFEVAFITLDMTFVSNQSSGYVGYVSAFSRAGLASHRWLEDFHTVRFTDIKFILHAVTNASSAYASALEFGKVQGTGAASSSLTVDRIEATIVGYQAVWFTPRVALTSVECHDISSFGIVSITDVSLTINSLRIQAPSSGLTATSTETVVTSFVSSGEITFNSNNKLTPRRFTVKRVLLHSPTSQQSTNGIHISEDSASVVAAVYLTAIQNATFVEIENITASFAAPRFWLLHRQAATASKMTVAALYQTAQFIAPVLSDAAQAASLRTTLSIIGATLRFTCSESVKFEYPSTYNPIQPTAVHFAEQAANWMNITIKSCSLLFDTPQILFARSSSTNVEMQFLVFKAAKGLRTPRPAPVSNNTYNNNNNNILEFSDLSMTFGRGISLIAPKRFDFVVIFLAGGFNPVSKFTVSRCSIVSNTAAVFGDAATDDYESMVHIIYFEGSAVLNSGGAVSNGGDLIVQVPVIDFRAPAGGAETVAVKAKEVRCGVIAFSSGFKAILGVFYSITVDGMFIHGSFESLVGWGEMVAMSTPDSAANVEIIGNTVNGDSVMRFVNSLICGTMLGKLMPRASMLTHDGGTISDYNFHLINCSIVVDELFQSDSSLMLNILNIESSAKPLKLAAISSAESPALLFQNCSIIVAANGRVVLRGDSSALTVAIASVVQDVTIFRTSSVLVDSNSSGTSRGGIVARDLLISIQGSIERVITFEDIRVQSFYFLLFEKKLGLGVGNDILVERCSVILADDSNNQARPGALRITAVRLGDVIASNLTLRDVSLRGPRVASASCVDIRNLNASFAGNVVLDNVTVDVLCSDVPVTDDVATRSAGSGDYEIVKDSILIQASQRMNVYGSVRVSRLWFRAHGFYDSVAVSNMLRVHGDAGGIVIEDSYVDLRSYGAGITNFFGNSDGAGTALTPVATRAVTVRAVRGFIGASGAQRPPYLIRISWMIVGTGGIPDTTSPPYPFHADVAVANCFVTLEGVVALSAIGISTTEVNSITLNSSNIAVSRATIAAPVLLGSSAVQERLIVGAPCSKFAGQRMTARAFLRASTALTLQQRQQLQIGVGTVVGDPEEFRTKYKVIVDPTCELTASATASHLGTPSHPLTLTANETLSHEATTSLTATTTRQFFLKAKREAFSGVAAVTSLGGMLGGGSAFSLTQKMMALQAMSQCPLSDPLAETPEAGLDSNLLGIRIYSLATFDNPSDVGDLQLSTSSTDAGRVVMASWRGAVISCFACAVIVVLVSAAVVYGRVLWSNMNSSKNSNSRSRNNSSRRRSSSSRSSSSNPAPAMMTFEKMSRTMGFPGFTIGAALTVSCASACTALGVIMSLFQAPAVDGPVFGFGVAALFVVPVGVLLWMGYRAHRDEKVKIAAQLPAWTEIHDKLVAAALKEHAYVEMSVTRARSENRTNRSHDISSSNITVAVSATIAAKTLYKYLLDSWATWHPSDFIDRWSMMTFDSQKTALWLGFDVFCTASISAAGGASFGCRNKTCCSALSGLTLAIVLVHSLALAWRRPHATRFDTALTSLTAVLSIVTAAIVVATGALSISPDVAAGFATTGQIIGFLAVLVGTIIPWAVEAVSKAVDCWSSWRADRRARLLDEQQEHGEAGRRRGGGGGVSGSRRNRRFTGAALFAQPANHHDDDWEDDRSFLREMLLTPAERQRSSSINTANAVNNRPLEPRRRSSNTASPTHHAPQRTMSPSNSRSRRWTEQERFRQL